MSRFVGQSSKAVDSIPNNLKILGVKKHGTWAYKVDLAVASRVDTEGEGLMQLGQGYEDGWIAFQIQDSRFQILDHKMVSGWANGWEVPASSTVYIFFWPQLLEFLGFGMLGLTMLILIRTQLDKLLD